jgi:hypothetical protein
MDYPLFRWTYFTNATRDTAATRNHAHNACLTIVFTPTGQVIDSVFYNKIEAKAQSSAGMGVASAPSVFSDAGAPAYSTEYKSAAIEAFTFDMGMQHLVQRVVVAMHEGDRYAVETWPDALQRARDIIEVVVVDAMSSAPSIVAARVGVLTRVMCDWWHRRKSFAKAVGKVAGYSKTGTKPRKASKWPALSNIRDAVLDIFNQALYTRTAYAEFLAQATASALLCGINVPELGQDDLQQWKKLMATAEEILEEVDPTINTSVNEQVHSHRNHFMVKGVKCTQERFVMLCRMAFMSWNMFPNWTRNLWNELNFM